LPTEFFTNPLVETLGIVYSDIVLVQTLNMIVIGKAEDRLAVRERALVSFSNFLFRW